MASSLRLITSNVVTRSFHPTLVSASRFLSVEASNRTNTNMPTYDFFDQSWLRILYPKISSMSICMEMTAERRNLKLNISDKAPIIDMGMCGLKMEDMRACDEPYTLFIQPKTQVPNKDAIMANIIANTVASFRDITAQRSWPYYDMFYDRSILGEGLCPVMAMLSPINSFSIYKRETADRLFTSMCIPADEDMKLTKQGLRVSLYLLGRDIKTYFDYDTLFIEAKTRNGHHITGIHLPGGVDNKREIKIQMEDGKPYAFIPCCRKKGDEDQLKSNQVVCH